MERLDRRTILVSIIAALGGVLSGGWREAEAQRARRVGRRRARRRVRRRHRRYVTYRVVDGRHVWVVPVSLAAGWELVVDEQVVVVKEVKVVENEGAKVEVAVVKDDKGETQELEIVREDTDDNSKELEGSILPDDDTTTPGVESEEEGGG